MVIIIFTILNMLFPPHLYMDQPFVLLMKSYYATISEVPFYCSLFTGWFKLFFSGHLGLVKTILLGVNYVIEIDID